MVTQNKKLDEIECPKCGHFMPVSEALSHQVSEQLKEQMAQQEKDFSMREKEIKDREAKILLQEKDVDKKVQERVAAATAGQLKDLKDREAKLAEAESSVDARVKASLAKEKAKLEADAERKAKESLSVEMADMKSELQESRDRLKTAEKAELDMLKRERALKEREEKVELETARRLSEQRTEVEQAVSKKFVEDQRLKDAEKDKVINDLKVALEDANRKAQQGSQQLQGEVQELELESILREMFPHDEIVPVAKGVNGADCLHIVKMSSGTVCGSILWESKRTKSWSEPWIKKLKDDQREAKADVAVIISQVLPKNLPGSGYRDRVWIGDFPSMRLIAAALRSQLVEVAAVKLASANKDDIGDMVFRYVTGPEFRQKVGAILDTLKEMQNDLLKEKRAAIVRLAKQEKQIEKVAAIAAGTYGDLRGLIGTPMQAIPALEEAEDAEPETPATKAIDYSKAEEIDPDDIPF